jgi:hypothetical protein
MRVVVLALGVLLAFNVNAQNKNSGNRFLLNVDEKFTRDGVIHEDKSDSGEITSITESGEKNGVSYKIHYIDGSGSFSVRGSKDSSTPWYSVQDEWSVACKKDAISDKKYCYLSRKDLFVFIQKNGKASVSVGTDNFPYRRSSIRVDSRKAITSPVGNDGDFSAAQSEAIVKEIAAGSGFVTRFVQWPYDSPVDATYESAGFKEAIEYLRWAIKRIR